MGWRHKLVKAPFTSLRIVIIKTLNEIVNSITNRFTGFMYTKFDYHFGGNLLTSFPLKKKQLDFLVNIAEPVSHRFGRPEVSGSLEDWLRPEGMTYQGFLFPRPATWPAYQKLIMMDGDG